MENVRLSGSVVQVTALCLFGAAGPGLSVLLRRPKSWVGDGVKGLSSAYQGSRDTKEWT